MAFKNHLGLEDLPGKLSNGQLPDTIVKNLIVGDINDTHIELIDDKLTVFRPNPDGTLVPTVQLGGSGQLDQLLLVDPTTGTTYAGFDDSGNGQVARDFSVGGELYVNGFNLQTDLLSQQAWGIQGGMRIVTDQAATGLTEAAQWTTDADLLAGRQYVYHLFANTSGTGSVTNARTYVYARYTTDGSTPSTSSPALFGWFDAVPNQASPWQVINLRFPFGVSSDCTMRILWTLSSPSVNAGRYVYARSTAPAFSYIEDIGPFPDGGWVNGQVINGGSGGGGGSGTITKTITIYPSWSRSFRNGNYYSGSENIHGYYGGNLNQCQWGFDFSPLVGGSIVSMSMSIYSVHAYYNSGFTGRVNFHTNSSFPSTYTNTAGTTFDVSGFPKPGWKTFNIPSVYWPFIVSGNYKGVAMGTSVPNSLNYYGRMDGSISGSTRAKITVKYTK